MEHKVYNQGPDDGDAAKTAEIKKFSTEAPADREHREATMDRASSEIFRRTRKLMLYKDLDYERAASLVVQSDYELSELWSRGFVRE